MVINGNKRHTLPKIKQILKNNLSCFVTNCMPKCFFGIIYSDFYKIAFTDRHGKEKRGKRRLCNRESNKYICRKTRRNGKRGNKKIQIIELR